MKGMALILHRSKYVILVGQRDHHLPDVVLEHVLVGDQLHVDIRPGQASHLLPLELLLGVHGGFLLDDPLRVLEDPTSV